MLDTVNRIKFFLVGILLLSSFFIGYGQLPSELPSQVSVVEPVVDTLVTPTDTLTAIPEQDEEDLAQEIVYPPIGIYGHDFLRQSSFARYSNQDQNRISDEYVLGPGDELVVSIWDEDAAISELLVISEEGFVQGAKIGRLNLAGVQFGNAEEIVKAKYSAFFNFNTSNFDLAISQAKTIMVDIVGEVEVPGTHQVSALNRLINVIMLSGGPTINGSVREIVVKRDGRVHKVMDLYEYLNNTDAGVGNIYLANNDVILIPPIGPVVRVDGPVRKPTSFELKERETFSDLLGFAGGFEPQAVKNAYQVLRYGDDDYFITDFSYNKDSKVGEEPLINGDLVQIKRISAQAENFVRAEGSFNLPGTYEYTENMRVSDLVKKSGNLKYDALSNRAFIRRKNDRLETVNIPINLAEILENVGSDSDILLYPRDIVTVFSKNRITETYSVEIFGEVKAPGTYNFSNELTIEDLILLAGGFSPSALNNEVELSRVIDYQQESGQLIPIRGAREKVAIDFSAFEDSESASQTKLTPYDQIFVRKVPEFELPKTISIEGEVVYPGAYPLGSKDMRVKDLIEQAGGLTPYAFAEGAKLYRRGEGLIETKLIEVERRESSKYNYVLKPGDRLEIPTIDEVVSIQGAIRSVIDNKQLMNTAYRGNKNAKWYIDNYGAGFDKNALRRSTQVVDPNGRLKGTKKFMFFNVYPEVSPGSTINVAYKEPKPEKEEGTGILGDLTVEKSLAIIASIASTIALINATR